ncbi:hypothetical protein E4U17_007883 [Claviceps sp. LM77 group G4]|nr:hypothetical protein E4U17_007883 [Claviceps sp. LM77 group G4]KAG6074998.1 hypothetical protein E4U16_003643 [Claviceps sp. LM84 group G4]KAG6085962.1 hypothetical protein E4U33_000475 [Claviceps sp. LM78 group G4]
MKIAILVTSLLSLGASALPEAEESITVGEYTYTGGDLPKGELKNVLVLRDLERRCRCSPWPCTERGQICEPGHCNCFGSNGCYSCNGGRYLCQPGPGSTVCLR